MSENTTPPSPTPGPSDVLIVCPKCGETAATIHAGGYILNVNRSASAPELRDRLAEAERLLRKFNALDRPPDTFHEDGLKGIESFLEQFFTTTEEVRAFLARPKEGT